MSSSSSGKSYVCMKDWMCGSTSGPSLSYNFPSRGARNTVSSERASMEGLTPDALSSKEILYAIVRDKFFPFAEEEVHSNSNIWSTPVSMEGEG